MANVQGEKKVKIFLTALLLTFSGIVFAESGCQNGDITSLTETWKSFRRASLHEAPEKIAKFYKFPLKLYSPTDSHGIDEKPILVSRSAFFKDYRSIFRESDLGEETVLFQELKTTTGNESIRRNYFDDKGCNSPPGPIGVESYDFIWDKKYGWQIESISYIGYADLIMRYKPGKQRR
jgi:hypothetical protein